ncbi:MAG TPA: RNA methyltransferase [Saprospiraceae bacterium]|nr:RNA methyltransferase [Saprospiraceae bacterium]
MISKAQIKDIRALHLPKFRQIYNKFIAEGDKVCIELLKKQKYVISDIFITQGNEAKYSTYLKEHTDIVTIVHQKDMEQMSALKTSSNILMLLQKSEDNTHLLNNDSKSAIYLDGVQDPGNVGTIIRIADWFGVDMVIRSVDSADFFNPKVVQATMGSLVNVDLVTATLPELLIYNRVIYGTFMHGQNLSETNIKNNGILVMGSEGKGIHSENEPLINEKITIPGAKSKIAESLNVSIAAGIICSIWKS